MMTRIEMIGRLMDAVRLLTGVLESLDPQASECGSCGHMRYEDFSLKQAADAIQGAMTRAEKARKYIDSASRAPKKEQP